MGKTNRVATCGDVSLRTRYRKHALSVCCPAGNAGSHPAFRMPQGIAVGVLVSYSRGSCLNRQPPISAATAPFALPPNALPRAGLRQR
jgi:hypothetical protein